ncbi:ATP-binding protein [Aliiroseovarius sp. S1339]|uniref:hybrid sensor histidine kinase/response regulator n=1 Tax=Aliiroseovarius sp. S1339 TaxID=2936990 RepID=UPI0020BD6780|nr:ATP-binding protein [Aliiroseovarius sp. S1339]MCK8464018.1 ATP-binding protein [Aliiroseovarius sp. S1339]
MPITRSRLIGLAASILLISTVVTGLFLGMQTRAQFKEVAASWAGYTDETAKKGDWISSLRGYLGYGGIIHNFKNYVLRGEEVYRSRVVVQLEQFDAVLSNYLAEPLPDEERLALTAIAATIAQYEAKLPIATKAAREGWPAAQTDALVRVDDSAAIFALSKLEQIWQQNRDLSTKRVAAAVSTGQTLIGVGFVSMFALVTVALSLGFLMMLLLRDMRQAMDNLSEELVHRRRLEQSQKLLAETVEQSPATILITDTDGHIEYANPKFIEVTGWSLNELTGKTPRMLQSGDTPDTTYGDIRKNLMRGEPWHGVFRNLRKSGGSYWAETTILPLKGADGMVRNFIGIGEDITEKRRAQEQVTRAQKMEAVGLMAGGIAHDFNNILTTIIGAAHMASLDAEEGSDLAGEVEQIDIAARRAQSLVRQLLTFARREPGVAVATDLCAVIGEVARLLRAAMPPTIVIETPDRDCPSSVLADPTHLHQILMNLCSNAAEAIGGKSGLIKISVSPPETEPPGLAARNDGWVRLTVEDDGQGMSQSTLESIFAPFFTTKPIGKGTGLGLAVVQGLVQEMGGQITVDSKQGQGARFILWLPAAGQLALAKVPQAEALPRGRGQILIIDDEVEVASIFRRLLQRLGYQVEAFSHATSGLARFRDNSDRYDLVILDLVMPEMSGDEVAAEIRALRPQCPILFCSAYRKSDLDLHGPKPGFLNKPVEPSQLAQRIKEMLQTA